MEEALPSPISASKTGFTICTVGLEWKYLVVGWGGACRPYMYQYWDGDLEVEGEEKEEEADVPANMETRLTRPANGRRNRSTRELELDLRNIVLSSELYEKRNVYSFFQIYISEGVLFRFSNRPDNMP